MEIVEIVKIAGTIIAIILGIIGAVPQIIQWSKPKPNLVLIFGDFRLNIERSSENNSIYHLNLLVSNDSRFLRRTTDATNVKAEYHIIDMNNEQCGGFGRLNLTSKLPIGESVHKEFDFHPECKEALNPHTLIVNISCDEGQVISRRKYFDFIG